jgi:hypothetical protein
VPNATENNWFEGHAGNQTLSGYGNFATGDLSLSSLTSGHNNVGMGSLAGRFMTSGSSNFALGSLAMWFNQSDSFNIAVGYLALATLGIGGAGSGGNVNNVAIGYGAFSNAEQGSGNVVIGSNALNNVATTTSAVGNTIIGNFTANSLGASGGSGVVLENTFIGKGAGSNLTGASQRNVWVGGYTGPSASVDSTIAISNGNGVFMMDCNLTSSFIWSFNMATNTIPACIHIYNMQSPSFTTTNYERAQVGWDINGNNIFTIGTQKGGTGATRNMEFVIGNTRKLDYGIATASVWTFADKIAVPGAANPVLTTTATITSGAGAGAGTLTNAPAAGDPTSWIPINDNGTTRYIPAW